MNWLIFLMMINILVNLILLGVLFKQTKIIKVPMEKNKIYKGKGEFYDPLTETQMFFGNNDKDIKL